MDWIEKIMYEEFSEEGIEHKITKEYECGWELVTMTYAGEKDENGYKKFILIFKYVG